MSLADVIARYRTIKSLVYELEDVSWDWRRVLASWGSEPSSIAMESTPIPNHFEIQLSCPTTTPHIPHPNSQENNLVALKVARLKRNIKSQNAALEQLVTARLDAGAEAQSRTGNGEGEGEGDDAGEAGAGDQHVHSRGDGDDGANGGGGARRERVRSRDRVDEGEGRYEGVEGGDREVYGYRDGYRSVERYQKSQPRWRADSQGTTTLILTDTAYTHLVDPPPPTHTARTPLEQSTSPTHTRVPRGTLHLPMRHTHNMGTLHTLRTLGTLGMAGTLAIPASTPGAGTLTLLTRLGSGLMIKMVMMMRGGGIMRGEKRWIMGTGGMRGRMRGRWGMRENGMGWDRMERI